MWNDISEESMRKLERIAEDEMLTQGEIRENLDVTEKGKIRQSIQNCKYALEHDPYLQGAICRNEMTCQIDIMKKVPWKRRGVQMTDTDMNNLSLYLEKNYGLESLTWDGTPRIRNMLTHFFGASDPEYSGEIMKMHMLAAISRLYDPGKKYDIMLCLVGGQGTGKSTFFKYLAIRDEWFTDDVKRLDDKRVYEYLQGHWIVEMSEMNAVANARSIEETKSFLSRQKDTYRIPYERRAEDRYRQCVFCGTSNDLAFLPFDRTGNRRFGPVRVCPEKAETTIYSNEKESREYILQAWAEAMEIYRRGDFSLTFSPDMEDYVKALQKEFMPEDTQTGMIQAFLDRYEEDYVCSTIIYQEVFHHEGMVPKWQSKEIGDLMDNEIIGWEKHGTHRFPGSLGTQRSWKRIHPKKDGDGFINIDENTELPFE